MEKYKTLADLKKAYDSIELTKKSPLMLDNDCSTVYVYASDEDEDGKCVFRGENSHPAALLEAALDLLGIPWQHC